MKSGAREFLIVSVLMITGLYFSIIGLVEAQPFLAPLSIAVLLAMVLVPVSNKLEGWGISRGWSSFVSVLVTMLFFIGLFFIISMQVKSIADDWPEIKEQLKPKIERLQQWIADTTGMEPDRQKEIIEDKIPGGSTGDSGSEGNKQSSSSANNTSGSQQDPSSSGGSGTFDSVGQVLLGFFAFLGTTLLTFIYIFFLLLYRSKLKKSILRFVPAQNRPKALEILKNSVRLSQSYLVGRLLLIFFLIILYAIGLSISGVKHAILISIIAALLSLIPYIGNVIGFFLAMAMATFSGGDTAALIGVIITFSVAQFVESYILEPYVVGHKVDLNPLMTILVVVLGEAVWGVTGMIISIPVFGILKIAFDNIPIFHPLGYALGEEDIGVHEKESFFERLVKNIKNKFSKS